MSSHQLDAQGVGGKGAAQAGISDRNWLRKVRSTWSICWGKKFGHHICQEEALVLRKSLEQGVRFGWSASLSANSMFESICILLLAITAKINIPAF